VGFLRVHEMDPGLNTYSMTDYAWPAGCLALYNDHVDVVRAPVPVGILWTQIVSRWHCDE